MSTGTFLWLRDLSVSYLIDLQRQIQLIIFFLGRSESQTDAQIYAVGRTSHTRDVSWQQPERDSVPTSDSSWNPCHTRLHAIWFISTETTAFKRAWNMSHTEHDMKLISIIILRSGIGREQGCRLCVKSVPGLNQPWRTKWALVLEAPWHLHCWIRLPVELPSHSSLPHY